MSDLAFTYTIMLCAKALFTIAYSPIFTDLLYFVTTVVQRHIFLANP